MSGRYERRPGAPDWIDDELLEALDGGLWHATDEAGWAAIQRDGAIVPGLRVNYPNAFCRSIGAVSLFDLSYPDSGVSPSAAHWSGWLGQGDNCPRIWIEIDREKAAANLLSPPETLARWRLRPDESRGVRIIAGIEAAHLGPIPLASTVQTLATEGGRLIGHADRHA